MWDLKLQTTKREEAPGSLFFLLLMFMVILTHQTDAFQGFPPPSFTSVWYNMNSASKEGSFREVNHTLTEVPMLIKVLVKIEDGPNENFMFEATGFPQVDDDQGSTRAGVTFIYNNQSVLIFVAATSNSQKTSHAAVMIAGAWGSEDHAQEAEKVQVQVQAWLAADFYQPDFISPSQVVTKGVFGQISYDLEETPEIVRVVGLFQVDGVDYYVEATGAMQDVLNRAYSNGGGVLFAYNDAGVRFWVSSSPFDDFIYSTSDGWGINVTIIQADTLTLQVYAWRKLGPLIPAFQSDWIEMDQNGQLFYEFDIPPCSSAVHVVVQALAVDGNNEGFIFPGTGIVQFSNGYTGGVLFGYSRDRIRLWLPNISTHPYSRIILVKKWGGYKYEQLSSKAKVQTSVWCGNSTATPFLQDKSPACQKFVPSQSEHSDLVRLESTPSWLMPDCISACRESIVCSAVLQTSVGCELYGQFQFGYVALAADTGDRLYHLAACDQTCP